MSLSSIDLFGFVRSFVREPDKSVLETSVFVRICSERGSADLTITLKEEGSERMYSADEIVFFGYSIGVNDRQYFKSFFKQQTTTDAPKRKRITIFTKDEKSEIEIKRSLQEMTDHNLSTLYGMNDLEIIKTAEVKNSPKQFRDFMLRNIMDEAQVRITMQQLLEHL